MKVKLIIFDMLGTTVLGQDDVHRFLQIVLENEGFHFTREEINQVMGYPKPLAIRLLLASRNAAASLISADNIDKIHAEFASQMITYYKEPGNAREIEGVSETFARLKEHGVRVAIDTGFSRDIAQTIIDQLGWERKHLIDASVTSDEVERGRPFPDMIFKIMDQLGIKDVSAVAKIGDTISDLEEGANAGCGWVVGVTSGAFTEAELKKGKFTHLIKAVPQLLQIIEIPRESIRMNV